MFSQIEERSTTGLGEMLKKLNGVVSLHFFSNFEDMKTEARETPLRFREDPILSDVESRKVGIVIVKSKKGSYEFVLIEEKRLEEQLNSFIELLDLDFSGKKHIF